MRNVSNFFYIQCNVKDTLLHTQHDFTKIRAVRAALIHAGRRTDKEMGRHDETKRRFLRPCECAL